jgi:PAS domain S-box-containing protein
MVGILTVIGIGILYKNAQNHKSFLQIRQFQSNELLLSQRQFIASRSKINHSFAMDYAYWNDMVKFVATSDTVWAHESIDVGLKNYAVDVLWIIRPSGEIVYSVAPDSTLPMESFPFIPAQSQWDSVSPLFMHQFVRFNGGLLELFTAPIQPINKLERAAPAVGLLACGVFWTEDYLRSMRAPMGCKTHLLNFPAPQIDTILDTLHESVVACVDTIRDMNGAGLAILLTQLNSPMLAEALEFMDAEIITDSIVALAVIFAIYMTLYFFVGRPLSLLASALSLHQPEQLDDLRHSRTEFAELARLIVRFFDQRDHLQNEIEDREKAELALQTNMQTLAVAEERYRRLVELSPDAIFVSKKGIITFANERAATLLKLRYPSELVNEPILKYVHSDFHEQTRMRLSTMEATGVQSPLTSMKCIAADGSAVDVEVITTPIRFQDETVFLTITRDISERLAAEQENQRLKGQLEVAQRMESLAVLAGGVAHDLNNMLGPLVAYPELILMDLPDDSPARPSLHAMETAAMQASEVVLDLLALARRNRYEMVPLCLDDVVRSYCESPNLERLKSKNPEIIVEIINGEIPKVILGSSHHLQKVLMNLVVNAFDAIKERQGKVTISTSSRILDRLDGGYTGISAGEYVILSVSDTGIGIDASDRQKIFEPYFSKKKMGVSGSGLGLAVVYGILKDHRGFYDLVSEEGKGSTFILYFPVTDQEVTLPADDKQVFPGHERILMIDDVPEQRAIASALLSSLGYKTHSVASGGEALKHLKEQSYDLLVIDMILEDAMDGLDAYKAVLEEHPNQKAIIVSGFSETERVKEMLRIGASAYVKKPYSRTVLSRAVRQSLDASRRELTAV